MTFPDDEAQKPQMACKGDQVAEAGKSCQGERKGDAAQDQAPYYQNAKNPQGDFFGRTSPRASVRRLGDESDLAP